MPDYTTHEGADYDFPLTATYETGEYITLAAHLNVRSGPSTAYAKLGRLPNGSRVTVIEVRGEWGKITYAGK
ncbi:MAG: SH3 domain-containing protein, partial [Clostridia bacterium]|nr:SH3 domain-containing protein [Clostridia bacterium]